MEPATKIEAFEKSLYLKILEQIKVVVGKSGLVVTLPDDTSMECKNIKQKSL